MRRTAALAAFLLLALAPLPDSSAAATPGARASVSAGAPVGTYRAVRFERRPLPAVERIPATKGYHHWVKLEQAVVTLRADGRFIASFRYWHHHLKDGAAVPDAPMLSETYRGSYVVRDGRVIFTPQAQRGKRSAPAITGLLEGAGMRVTYPVQAATGPRALRLDLERDGSW